MYFCISSSNSSSLFCTRIGKKQPGWKTPENPMFPSLCFECMHFESGHLFCCSCLVLLFVKFHLPLCRDAEMSVWNSIHENAHFITSLMNQHTRELISAWKTSHKHNNKDPSHQRKFSAGMWVNPRYTNSTTGTSLSTSGGVYVLILHKCSGPHSVSDYASVSFVVVVVYCS